LLFSYRAQIEFSKKILPQGRTEMDEDFFSEIMQGIVLKLLFSRFGLVTGVILLAAYGFLFGKVSESKHNRPRRLPQCQKVIRSLSYFPPKKPGFYNKNGGVTEIL
jgi:hypothetical protein